ncbi:MAG: hypothetical protein ACE5WD_09130 [Candidatus Aminicenantia bacterium]
MKNFFSQLPFPEISIYFSANYLAGIKVDRKEKFLKDYFVFPFERGIIEPSFIEENIKDKLSVKEKIREGINKLNPSSNKLSLLIPETSVKVFLLNFGSLPSRKEETEELVLWRVKKQIPIPKESVRFAWQQIKSNNQIKVIVMAGSEKVIAQYENFFSELGFQVKLIESSIFNLLNIIRDKLEGNTLLINLEKSYLTLLGLTPFEIVIYRVKSILPSGKEEVFREISNTLKFLGDKAEIEINSFWVRAVSSNNTQDWLRELYKEFSVPVNIIDPFQQLQFSDSSFEEISLQEKQILLPLIGQTLWKDSKL